MALTWTYSSHLIKKSYCCFSFWQLNLIYDVFYAPTPARLWLIKNLELQNQYLNLYNMLCSSDLFEEANMILKLHAKEELGRLTYVDDCFQRFDIAGFRVE